jgi:hypothetical protein
MMRVIASGAMPSAASPAPAPRLRAAAFARVDQHVLVAGAQQQHVEAAGGLVQRQPNGGIGRPQRRFARRRKAPRQPVRALREDTIAQHRRAHAADREAITQAHGWEVPVRMGRGCQGKPALPASLRSLSWSSAARV